MDRSDFEIEESVFWDIRNYFDKGTIVKAFNVQSNKDKHSIGAKKLAN